MRPSSSRLRVAKGRYPFALFGYCPMSNHFHLLLKPGSGQSISRILQSLSVAHTWRYHKRHRTSGHVWQGRFKSPVIQDDDHLLVVLRYIEANPAPVPVWSPTRGTTGGRAMASTGWDWLTRSWTVSPSGRAPRPYPEVERRRRWRAKLAGRRITGRTHGRTRLAANRTPAGFSRPGSRESRPDWALT